MNCYINYKHILFPIEYIKNPNLYRVIEISQTSVVDNDIVNDYINKDFDKEYNLYLQSIGVDPEKDKDMGFDKLLEFNDDYPFSYLLINIEYIDLNFRDDNIFIIELINLLDIPENQKYDIYDGIINDSCIIIKLNHLLRNINSFPIPDTSELLSLAKKIDFEFMCEVSIEF
jgi:hypothetical protein